MDHSQENELIARFRSGDKEVFSKLFEANRRSVITLALQFVRREDAALDVAQEVFLRAYERLINWRGEARLSTWLFRATVNVAMEHLRAEEKHRHLDTSNFSNEPVLSPEKAALQNELYAAVNQAVGQLPPRQRLIITLKHQNGLKLNEIAELLGITLGGAKASYHKALMALREKLRPWAPPVANVVADEEEIVEAAFVVQTPRKALNAIAAEIERNLAEKIFGSIVEKNLPQNLRLGD